MALADLFLARCLFDAQRRGDSDTFLELCHPRVEFQPLSGSGEVYRGRDGVGRFFSEARITDMDVVTVPQNFVDDGDRVLVVGRLRVRRAGGLTDSPAVWCLEMQDGLVRRIVPFTGEPWAHAAAA